MRRAQVKTDEQIDRERTPRSTSRRAAASRLRLVAGQSLRTNSELFLQLAREHLGQHQQIAATALMQREKAIEALLAPIREALSKTEQQMQRIEKERAETFGSLRSSIEAVTLGQQALQRETRNLVNALRRPEVRGQWGEMTLRRLAELAGMVEHCDFAEQVHVAHRGRRPAAGHDRAHARRPRPRRRREDAARCLPRSGRSHHRRSSARAALRRHAQAVAERVRAARRARATGASSSAARTS